MKFLNYKKFGKCFYYTNKKIHLLVTLECGPRIIFLGNDLKHNLLFEDINDEFCMKTNEFKKIFGKNETWHVYGGHRLWASPESIYTYEPDNAHVKIKKIKNNFFAFIAPIQKISKLQFILKIMISGGCLNITHTIINHNKKAKTLSLWAITAFAKGTAKILANTNDTGFLPNRKFVLWPYTKINDPRLTLNDDAIYLKTIPTMKEPIKIGIDATYNKAMYLANDTCLTIESKYMPNAQYPDGGCNIECYTNNLFLEIETLSPLVSLKYKEQASHIEKWTLSKSR